MLLVGGFHLGATDQAEAGVWIWTATGRSKQIK